jgi:predicted dehydrogenase
LRFKNNIIGEVHLDYFQQPSYRGCKVIGTNGTLLWNINSNVVRLYNVRKKKWIDKMKLPRYDMNLMYVEELRHFLNCVINRRKSINDVEEGIKILKIALAVKKSSKIKKAITLGK